MSPGSDPAVRAARSPRSPRSTGRPGGEVERARGEQVCVRQCRRRHGRRTGWRHGGAEVGAARAVHVVDPLPARGARRRRARREHHLARLRHCRESVRRHTALRQLTQAVAAPLRQSNPARLGGVGGGGGSRLAWDHAFARVLRPLHQYLMRSHGGVAGAARESARTTRGLVWAMGAGGLARAAGRRGDRHPKRLSR